MISVPLKKKKLSSVYLNGEKRKKGKSNLRECFFFTFYAEVF